MKPEIVREKMAGSRNPKFRHGMSGTPIHDLWMAMLDRCYSKTHCNYKKYGARGISVCERWHTFEMFYEDMGDRPDGKMTLERINNDGNYEPGNVIWATYKTQANNHRRNRLITFDGKTLNAMQWSELTGINYDALLSRIHRGWPVNIALTTPIQESMRRPHAIKSQP